MRERKRQTENMIELGREKDENNKKTKKKEAEGFDDSTADRNEEDKIECGTSFMGKEGDCERT